MDTAARHWNDTTLGSTRRLLGALRVRIGEIEVASLSITTDSGLLKCLATIEEAIRPAGLHVGSERRAAKMREDAKRAAATLHPNASAKDF